MGSLSIDFGRLGVGSSYLDAKFVLPAHKKRVESALSRYFWKTPPSERNIALAVTTDPQLKEVGRVVRYYQHMGLLPSKSMGSYDEELRKRITSTSVKALQKASVPGTKGQLLAGARIAEDTVSLFRNILFAVPIIGPNNPVVNHLGYYVGFTWGAFSVREFLGGVDDLKQAQTIHDAEGVRRAQARMLSGTLVSTASGAYLAGRVCDSLNVSVGAMGAMAVANTLFGLGAFLAMGMSYLGWYRCRDFGARLNEYLQHPHIAEVDKFIGALRFLKEAGSVTAEEMAALRLQIEQDHPTSSPLEKEILLQKELAHLTEAKVKYLKRRTSVKGLRLILDGVDSLLLKLADEKKRPEAIKEAALLIQQIQNETRVKMSLHLLNLIAATLSFIAMVIAHALGMGMLTFVLWGIAGALYLSIEVYNAVGLFKRKDQKDLGAELHPLQDLGCRA